LLAIALPADAAISELIALLTGAFGLTCPGAPGPAGLSPLQPIARIRTPAKLTRLKERLYMLTPRLLIDGLKRGDKPRNCGRQRQTQGQSSAVSVSH
jgi:hypothetical protein